LGGVVLPNQTPDVIPQIAQRYGINYLVLEYVTLANGEKILAASHALWFDPDSPPDFLVEVPIDTPDVRLYEIHP
jgi:hypothetical protein